MWGTSIFLQVKDYTDIANEVETLKGKKHKMLVKKALDEDTKRRIKDMEEFLKSQSREITEYDEELVRKYIKQSLMGQVT